MYGLPGIVVRSYLQKTYLDVGVGWPCLRENRKYGNNAEIRISHLRVDER
jgi:hypothetical protein